MAPALSLQLPSEYGWTLLAATSTFFVNNYIVMLVSRSRKAAGIKYPNHYATPEQADKDPNAFKFNCGRFMCSVHENS